MSDQYYKLKYLKYKQKYLYKIRNIQKGGDIDDMLNKATNTPGFFL
jgi:hypothetical protein